MEHTTQPAEDAAMSFTPSQIKEFCERVWASPGVGHPFNKAGWQAVSATQLPLGNVVPAGLAKRQGAKNPAYDQIERLKHDRLMRLVRRRQRRA